MKYTCNAGGLVTPRSSRMDWLHCYWM